MGLVLKYGMKGPMVRDLQTLLRDNRYHKVPSLKVDGEFGPRTAAAVHETKHWMGYKRGYQTPVAGLTFMNLITGKQPLGADRRARRLKRLNPPKPKPVDPWVVNRHKALNRAQGDLGLLEGPNNAIKYNDWWCSPRGNDGGAYCVRGLAYWWAPFCSAVVRGSAEWQNTDYLLAAAKKGAKGVRLVADPKPGDIGVIDFDGHADPDHGLMVEVAGDNEYVKTIEANATLPNGRQGVGRHQRPKRNCWFIRITK